jgi:hypothetical protein
MYSTCRGVLEAFVGVDSGLTRKREIYVDVAASIISFILAVAVLAFVGKWLWNTSITELFTFARPAKSVWEIIGLFIFVSLLK